MTARVLWSVGMVMPALGSLIQERRTRRPKSCRTVWPPKRNIDNRNPRLTWGGLIVIHRGLRRAGYGRHSNQGEKIQEHPCAFT